MCVIKNFIMSDTPKCLLCESVLGDDCTILGSNNFIETLSFLKGCSLEVKKYKVCLACWEKIKFVSSLRTSAAFAPQAPPAKTETSAEIYDSEEQELDDLCAFYAEQDFKFDDTSSSSSEAPAEPHRDDDKESKKNKPKENMPSRLRARKVPKCGETGCRGFSRKRNIDFVIRCPQPDCKRTFTRGGSGRKLKTHLKKFHNPATREEVVKAYKFECSKCFALFKSSQTLKCHEEQKHSDSKTNRVKCPHCNYQVLSSRKTELFRNHIRSVHPEFKEEVEEHRVKMNNRKADLAIRAKIQCFLCSFAGVKISNMHRHYSLVHGYDKTQTEKNSKADPDHPDGALCPQCGEHFVNRHTLMKHLLKIHSKVTGEQCLYCAFRYHDIMEHIERSHSTEMKSNIQICKKCQPDLIVTSFNDLLNHTRSQHRKLNSANEFESGPTNIASKDKRTKRSKSGLNLPDQQHVPEPTEVVVTKSSKKKYVPVHMSGICPYCELKFSDLLGHLRHNHDEEKGHEKKECQLCGEKFGSIRELVSHRQLHPRFKSHTCVKCSSEFETVVELRKHRKECPKYKRKRRLTMAALQGSTSSVPEAKSVALNQTTLTIPNAVSSSSSPSASGLALATLMSMANDLDEIELAESQTKQKTLEYEGRGTVPCHSCSKTFTLKTLLRRHYISHHSYDPAQATDGSDVSSIFNWNEASNSCQECRLEFTNIHGKIRHQLEVHATISGQICPYCDSKWGWKKFDRLDEHVTKYHVLEMLSPVQTCSTCKTNFVGYEDLKVHRQLHEGGNRKLTLLVAQESVSVHPMVGAKPEIVNRGGVKCQLCSAFKLRKDHLKLHYIKHHSYLPKLAVTSSNGDSTIAQAGADPFFDGENLIECSNCPEKFSNQHLLIKHLLKEHCTYSGLICPYCRGAFPQRFIDLQAHVTAKHMDQLTGYNVCNQCQVCSRSFSGYAELRDHVQIHGDAYRERVPVISEKKKLLPSSRGYGNQQSETLQSKMSYAKNFT